ncbi:MAG: hypothetical protein ACYDDA_03675 [Acidiferrobacteraceae bacterium]
MSEGHAATAELPALNRIFIDAFLALGRGDHKGEACRLATAAWSVLCHGHPEAAKRFNGVLHTLTRNNRSSQRSRGGHHVRTENP